jgi:pyridinium-3,5-biscarboxylic acid mononucleotide synthase
MNDVIQELLLGVDGSDTAIVGERATVRADLGREGRKGVPEVILADRKRPEDALAAARAFLDRRGRAILSRVPPPLVDRLRDEFPASRIEAYPASGMVVLKRSGFVPPPPGGRVGVITAGTSDVPVAEEALVVAAEMGCDVATAYDVGVAGLHRLAEPLRELRQGGVDVIIVAAGMDGALPSVVAGLVDVPVIGLPTSVGYGLGGRGVAALLSMLQTCAPGLTVVNIDNGVGAGATAAIIANRVAAARRS